MKSFISFALVLLLISCSRLALDTREKQCPVTDAVKNNAGQRLPVAISYRMPSAWLKTGEAGPMVFDERVIDPITQAKLKVFYFEGMQGKNEANLQRWTKQFLEEDRDLISQQNLEINEIPVLEFIMSGTYKEKVNPMDPHSESSLRPKHSMRAYIIETQTGTWFFKAVAPSYVIEKLDSKFKEFVNTIKESY